LEVSAMIFSEESGDLREHVNSKMARGFQLKSNAKAEIHSEWCPCQPHSHTSHRQHPTF